MRAMNDAVVTGIGTVLADDPQLTCRLPGMEPRSPVRVVLDSSLRTPLKSKLAVSATRTLDWVFVDEQARPNHEAELAAGGVEVLRVSGAQGRLDLTAVLRSLAGRGITRVLVEAGPILSAAFLQADLVDEAALFCSPHPLGDGIDALEGLPLTALTQSPKLRLVGSEQVGADRLKLYQRA
jgi:diaminohydroxyphosphoribosylaminopyrimidine deaminase/5-amino-6-(5-phosphoribosylamino)uracil reductase